MAAASAVTETKITSISALQWFAIEGTKEAFPGGIPRDVVCSDNFEDAVKFGHWKYGTYFPSAPFVQELEVKDKEKTICFGGHCCCGECGTIAAATAPTTALAAPPTVSPAITASSSPLPIYIVAFNRAPHGSLYKELHFACHASTDEGAIVTTMKMADSKYHIHTFVKRRATLLKDVLLKYGVHCDLDAFARGAAAMALEKEIREACEIIDATKREEKVNADTIAHSASRLQTCIDMGAAVLRFRTAAEVALVELERKRGDWVAKLEVLQKRRVSRDM